jgi:hypothetical protein
MMAAPPPVTLENAIRPARPGTGEMAGEAALGDALGDADSGS